MQISFINFILWIYFIYKSLYFSTIFFLLPCDVYMRFLSVCPQSSFLLSFGECLTLCVWYREWCASVVSQLKSVKLLTESCELHRWVRRRRWTLAETVVQCALICCYDLPTLQHTRVKACHLSASLKEVIEVSLCVRLLVCVPPVTLSVHGSRHGSQIFVCVWERPAETLCACPVSARPLSDSLCKTHTETAE